MKQEQPSCRQRHQMLYQYMSVLELRHHKLDPLPQRELVMQLRALQATLLLKLARMRVI
jgi:hypothetical protein